MSSSESLHSIAPQLVLAESAPDPILTIDERSTMLYANSAAVRAFGYAAEELVGQSMLLLIPERYRANHEEGIARYARTGERRISWQGLRVPILTKAGVEIPVEISFGEFELGGRRLFSGFLRDVTDQVAAADAIAGANHRLQQQAVELEQQIEEAQALTEALAQNSEEAEDRALEAVLAADRARRLLTLSTRLNRAMGAAEVADLILEIGMEAVGADAGSFAVIGPSVKGDRAKEFEVIRTRGFTANLTAEYRRFALSPGRPLSDAAIERSPVLVNSRAAALGRYPTLTDVGYEGFAALPVIVGDEVVAAIAFSFSEAQEFDESSETFLRTVAEQFAQALERARLYDAAEAQASKSGFVAEASRLLASSMEYETLLSALADFSVPRLADWCAIDIVNDPTATEWPPHLTRLAVAHDDPVKRMLGLSLEENFPTDWNSHAGTPAVMREGTAQFIPVLTDEMLQRASRSEDHLRALRALNFRSVIMVPLIARGLTLGVLTLVMGDSGRRFGEEDVALATDVALRAATAIDNARLFRDARRASAVAESALGRAAMASKAKSNFLATMSHEIRTPINAVLGYSELLALELAGPLTIEQRAQVERIRASTGHLLTLVNEVLDLAKIESGTLRVDLRESVAVEAVNSALGIVRLQALAKRLNINEQCAGECDARYVGDGDRVRQILVNLIANAVKFTVAGGSILVECSTVQGAPSGASRGLDGRHVAFRVSDTGIGIPADQLEHIFEAFVQGAGLGGNPYTREQTGTGLGLAISRQLAYQMRGEITVESQPGFGSTFTLYLPAAEQGF